MSNRLYALLNLRAFYTTGSLCWRARRLAFFALTCSSLTMSYRPARADQPLSPYKGRGLMPTQLRCEALAAPLGLQELAPRLSWIVESGERGQKQTAYRLLVASSHQLLAQNVGDLWDPGRVPGDDTLNIVYRGKPLVSYQRCFWKLKVWDKDGHESPWSRPSMWSMGLLHDTDWKAQWIGFDQNPTQAHISSPPGLFLPPASFFRKQFTVDKPLLNATLYVTALGLVDMHLNGQPVSDDFFTPGWTDYSKRVYYRAYDVTARIQRGPNALGAVLADGWFSGYVGYNRTRDNYGKHPRLLAQLHLEFTDGSSADVATGPDWKATTGPVLQADFLQGETYDARRELPGWDAPGCDESAWHNVLTGTDEVHPLVQVHPGPPVRAIQEFKAQSVTEPSPGIFVLNLGQNFAGVARLRTRGERGQKITLRFAERLNPDGTIYTKNLRSARATDTYICKGSGLEVWHPDFTFHGFQYIEVTGLNHKPAPDEVVGLALSSDTPVVGSFNCSDPMLNRLHQNIYWTQRANFIDIPTDCPQRDERLGWTGDAQVYVRTATLNTDVQPFFTKWLVDLDDDGQRADGEFPCVAPVKISENDGGPAWADAGVICPWTIYSVYDDPRILERHYDAMARFIEFCRNRSTPDLLPPPKYHCFGDWLNIHDDTPKDVICTAYFAYSTKLTAQAAAVLGKTEAAAKYEALFERIRAAFNHAYVEPDGRIKGNTQTDYVLALAFDLVQGQKAQQAAQHLVDNIRKRDWHLSTGFIGTKDLMPVLSKIGRTDVAYRLLHNDTFPSWGFSIKQGATSIWERWDGWTPEKGFQDPGMNSFAHYSFGAVYAWMVDHIGGILRTAPGYKQMLIAPQPDGKLRFASVSYRSVHGDISTHWQETNGRFLLDVSIPANTTAIVALPGTGAITESGRPLEHANGVQFLRQEGNTALLSIGSGTYEFLTKW